jgi:hypothetical protein
MNPFLLLVALAVPSAAAQTDHRPLQGAPWSRHAIDDEGRGADHKAHGVTACLVS